MKQIIIEQSIVSIPVIYKHIIILIIAPIKANTAPISDRIHAILNIVTYFISI